MTCPFDLKEYALGESSREEARRIQAHAAECGACSDELTRLQLTRGALLSLADEEMPRRIAFVSDKVFEPRWYQRLWTSVPQLGFLAAAMLSGAILVHAFYARPAPAPAAPASAAALDTRAIQQHIESEVGVRVNDAVQHAVAQAVAASEARQKKQTAALLEAARERYEFDRRATLAAFSEQTRIVQRQLTNMYAASNNLRAGE